MGFIGALWPHDEVKYSHILMQQKQCNLEMNNCL